MSRNWIERPLKKIERRRWENLAGLWVNFIPISLGHPQTSIACDTALVSDVRHLIDSNKAAGQPVYEWIDAPPNFRSSCFLESLFLYSKACNLLANAQTAIDLGFCNWSVSTAYQAAFFAARALLQLLGVCPIKCEKAILVDYWGFHLKKPRELAKLGKGERPIWICMPPKSTNVEHRPVWKALHRLLSITSFPQPHSVAQQALSSVSVEDISAHRHILHYETPGWFFMDEVMLPKRQEEFGIMISPTIRAGDDDFTLQFGATLVALVRQMFNSIAGEAEILRQKLEEIDVCLQEDFHKLTKSALDLYSVASS